jgi:hypothetical protein
LPNSEALSVVDAGQALRACDARLIAIIGAHDAGKTSLIASLYDKFQEGTVLEIQYARSRTLHALERVCHDARAASLQAAPHSPHTPFGEVRFYELRLAGGPLTSVVTLLLADRAGEDYRGLTDDHSNAKSFPELERADSLTILVDGNRLVNASERHNQRSEITLIFQALVESGVLSGRQQLAFVLTKLDIVLGSTDPESAKRRFHDLSTHIAALYGSHFSTIQTFQTAASPVTASVPRGTGVAELLRFWIDAAPASPTKVPPARKDARAFSQLQPPPQSKSL